MCLLEFECAKRLKAHSRAIPAIKNVKQINIEEYATYHQKKLSSWTISNIFIDHLLDGLHQR